MFQIGDKVKGLNEALEGIVVKVVGSIIHVESDGFDYPIDESELIKVSDSDEVSFKPKPFKTPKARPEIKLSNFENTYAPISLTQRNKKGVLEVDLHVGPLLKWYPNLKPKESLTTQKYHAERCVEEAIRRNEKRLVLIHGRGEGKLEEELRSIYEGRAGIRVEDASFHLYGSGAIELFFKY